MTLWVASVAVDAHIDDWVVAVCKRRPQSVQSVPSEHNEYSAPGPPSSQ